MVSEGSLSDTFTGLQKYSDNSVVFDGERTSWQKYLGLSLVQRYESEILLGVNPNSERDGLEFNTLNQNFKSEKLARFLKDGFSLFIEKLRKYETAADIIKREILANHANTIVPIKIKCSHHLPSDSTREIFLDSSLNIKEVSIVLNGELVQSVSEDYKKLFDGGDDERLGILWGLVKPLLHELGHSNLPRDRFFEEIHQVWCDCVAMRNILFKNKRENGCLVPNKAGNVMMNCRGQIKGIDLDFYQKAPPLPQAFMQDFFLLSWACLLLFINAPRKDPMPSEKLKDDIGNAMQKGADSLKDALLEEWKFVDLSGREAKEFIDAFVDIIFRSRANTYGENPDLFEQGINRLIYLKRFFFEREIVMTTPKLHN